MSEDRKGRPVLPKVQVVKRPGPVTPSADRGPAPVVPKPVPRPVPKPRAVAPTPGAAVAPRPAPAEPFTAPRTSPPLRAEVVVRPSVPGLRRPPPRGRSGGPRGPVTPELVAALARKERVPTRIAKGELDGKMTCRIWKKLHADKAVRFAAAWTLVESNAGLGLAEAFAAVQAGISVEELAERRQKAKERAEVMTARQTVDGEAIDAYIQRLVTGAVPCSLVLGERALQDAIVGVEPVAFQLQRSGRLEKLQVVVLAPLADWEKVGTRFPRDPQLSRRPAAVARQPRRRPVCDPRPLLPHVGARVAFALRNGLEVTGVLWSAGPFDVLVDVDDAKLFIPLHAMLSWKVAPPAA